MHICKWKGEREREINLYLHAMLIYTQIGKIEGEGEGEGERERDKFVSSCHAYIYANGKIEGEGKGEILLATVCILTGRRQIDGQPTLFAEKRNALGVVINIIQCLLKALTNGDPIFFGFRHSIYLRNTFATTLRWLGRTVILQEWKAGGNLPNHPRT